jgi:hypothetical protein
VTDLQNTPAVEPEEEGGNERAGLRVAGALAVFVGWGLGVFLNVLLHVSAHSGGRVVGWVRVYPALGPYAWGVLALGVFTGVFGIAMIWVSQFSKAGALHLPGTSY